MCICWSGVYLYLPRSLLALQETHWAMGHLQFGKRAVRWWETSTMEEGTFSGSICPTRKAGSLSHLGVSHSL